MCKCTPNKRTPFCGAPGCEWPEQVPRYTCFVANCPGNHVSKRQVCIGVLQTREERLREVSRATVDAKLLGFGVLMILPDNSFRYVPANRITIALERDDESIHATQEDE